MLGDATVTPSAPATAPIWSLFAAKTPRLLSAMMSAPVMVAATSVATLLFATEPARPTLREIATPTATVSILAVEPLSSTTSPVARRRASATSDETMLATLLSTTERPSAAAPMPMPSEPALPRIDEATLLDTAMPPAVTDVPTPSMRARTTFSIDCSTTEAVPANCPVAAPKPMATPVSVAPSWATTLTLPPAVTVAKSIEARCDWAIVLLSSETPTLLVPACTVPVMARTAAPSELAVPPLATAPEKSTWDAPAETDWRPRMRSS